MYSDNFAYSLQLEPKIFCLVLFYVKLKVCTKVTIKELYNIHLALLAAFIHFRISAEDKNVTFDLIFETIHQLLSELYIQAVASDLSFYKFELSNVKLVQFEFTSLTIIYYFVIRQVQEIGSTFSHHICQYLLCRKFLCRLEIYVQNFYT